MILDKEFNEVDDYDPEAGALEASVVDVTVDWVVDVPESGHYEVVAEYDNGGIDQAWVVDVPEKGHWRIMREGRDRWDNAPINIPDDWPHDVTTIMDVDYDLYTPYTKAELKRRAQEAEEREAAHEAAQWQVECLNTLPDAVAELSNSVSAGADDISGIADAVAELSEIVSSLMAAKEDGNG